MRSRRHLVRWGAIALAAGLLAGPAALGQYQRSPPDFSGSDYALPTPAHPEPVTALRQALDAGLLGLGLVLSAWLVLRRRSRAGAIVLGIASLVWFGFVRQGCICPIGAIGNVTLALAETRYAVSLVVVAVFFLPLLAALLAGRVFCSGVCPHGAIQDLVLIRPVRVPRALDRALGLVKYAYLALAVWWAGWGLAPLIARPAGAPGTARRFIICDWDPFVGIFRRSGSVTMIAIGAALLLLSTVVGRPYCRWLCPYGALLATVSRVAWKHLVITPDKELDCGLCNDACPFGAIEEMRAVKRSCLSCGRCYEFCPREHELRKAADRPVPPEAIGGLPAPAGGGGAAAPAGGEAAVKP